LNTQKITKADFKPFATTDIQQQIIAGTFLSGGYTKTNMIIALVMDDDGSRFVEAGHEHSVSERG